MSPGVCGSVRPRITIEYLSLTCTVFTSRFPKGLSHSIVLVEESLTRQLPTASPAPASCPQVNPHSTEVSYDTLANWITVFLLVAFFCFVYWTVPIIPILS